MMRILFITALCLLPVFSWADAQACFNGQWQFDKKASDNPERLLKKLQRQQKQQEQVLNRSKAWANEEKEDLSLTNALPSFVFSAEDMAISVTDNKVLITQHDYPRELYTNGHGQQGISLKGMQQQSDTVVAGWEGKALIIETTTVKGSRLKEIISLNTVNELQSDMIIKNTLNKKEFLLTKIYQRLDHASTTCILNN